jgi:hypothetical protein
MSNKSIHQRVARGIYKRISASGQVYYLTYDGTDSSGKAMWKKHDTREAAEEHRNQLRIARLNEGRKTWALTPDQREDAARATELLTPYSDAKLVHAARYYIDHVLKVQDSKTVTEAVAALLLLGCSTSDAWSCAMNTMRRTSKVSSTSGPSSFSCAIYEMASSARPCSGQAHQLHVGEAAFTEATAAKGDRSRIQLPSSQGDGRPRTGDGGWDSGHRWAPIHADDSHAETHRRGGDRRQSPLLRRLWRAKGGGRRDQVAEGPARPSRRGFHDDD